MSSRKPDPSVDVRQTRHEDFDGIIEVCRRVYPDIAPWNHELLGSHLDVFPNGQLVAIDRPTGRIVGMAASLIISWDDYHIAGTWNEFTDRGRFTNHDPHGHTLYGAEVMVDPSVHGRGIGKKIYAARREICRSLDLRRIRAGARLRGYGTHADAITADEYVIKVVNRELGDPTLSFQLKQGFRVIAVVEGYLNYDPASRGWGAVIEWINHKVAHRQDYRGRDPRYGRRRRHGLPGDP